MFATLGGGIVRMTVELDGPASPRATALTALPMPELAPLRRTLRVAPMALAECGARIAWDSKPTDAEPGSAAVVLMNRSFALRVAQTAERTGRVAARHPSATVAAGALSRQRLHVLLYLECRVAGRTWRSEVDWFVDLQR